MNSQQRRIYRRKHNLTLGKVGDVVHWVNPFGGISTGVVVDSSPYGEHLRCVQTQSAHNNRPLVLMKAMRAGTGAGLKAGPSKFGGYVVPHDQPPVDLSN